MGPGHMAMGFQLQQVGHAGFDSGVSYNSQQFYSQASGCFLEHGWEMGRYGPF